MMYLRTTSFSTNLERIGVTDIGRRSEKVLTAGVLGTGVTRAVFHEEGRKGSKETKKLNVCIIIIKYNLIFTFIHHISST